MKEFQEWMRENQWVLIMPLFLIIGYYLAKWKVEQKRDRKKIIKEREDSGNRFLHFKDEKIEYFVDDSPTKPTTFGRKATWIAIKSVNHEEIVGEFKKVGKKSFRTNLESGVYGSYASNIFVFPPIMDWTLVIHPEFNIELDEQLQYLKEMSKKYDEVQFFGSFRGVGYSAWGKFVRAETIRAYSVADGIVNLNIGELTERENMFIEEEIQKSTDEDELNWIKNEGKLLCMSDEENVLRMAGEWSINPDKLDGYLIEGLGTIIEA
jgi:hypothetical protein